MSHADVCPCKHGTRTCSTPCTPCFTEMYGVEPPNAWKAERVPAHGAHTTSEEQRWADAGWTSPPAGMDRAPFGSTQVPPSKWERTDGQ